MKYFYPEEIKDLIISALLLLFLLIYKELDLVIKFPYVIITFVIVSFLSFILHEIAHKITAMRYGFISFYMLNPSEALTSILLSLFLPFMVLSFGATNIIDTPYSDYSKKSIRNIAAVGPMVNIVLGILLYILSIALLEVSPNLAISIFLAAKINLWLAIFNLLPIPPLDGFKIFSTDFVFYIIYMGLTLLLYFIMF